MDIAKYEALALKLKIIGHPMRLCILNGISKKGCHVKQICEDLGVPQPVISLHLSKLKAAGIVVGEREGNFVYYRVIDKTALRIIEMLPR